MDYNLLDDGEQMANHRHTINCERARMRHLLGKVTLAEYAAEVDAADMLHADMIGDIIRLALRS